MTIGFKHLKRSGLLSVIICLASIWTTSSCISTKSIVYFQGDTLRNSSQKIAQSYTPTLQPNDILSIVIGSLNQEASEVFNTPNLFTTTSTNYSANGGASRNQPLGYLVENDGSIELPLIGKVKVGGLRTTDAADTIRLRLTSYLKEPTVIVRNLNFKVSILGEVARPAVYVIPDEKITLPEVLSNAGDLTIFGRRDNVMIIREENDTRQYARVDLTKRDIFNSPYYYIHKNDVIYVEPIKTKAGSTDRTLQLAPLILSFITAASLVFYRVAR